MNQVSNGHGRRQINHEELKKAIQGALRLEPRSLTSRLAAEITCEEEDAVVKVSNEDCGMVVLSLSSVEKKYSPEEKELAALAKYWSALKDLAQGIKVITQSQVHRYLRKATVESTKATNARWGRWEDILLDLDMEIGPAQPPSKKTTKPDKTPKEPYEWTLYTDGSRKGHDSSAYWGFILKQGEKERIRQKGKVPGSAQAGDSSSGRTAGTRKKKGEESTNNNRQLLLCSSPQ